MVEVTRQFKLHWKLLVLTEPNGSASKTLVSLIMDWDAPGSIAVKWFAAKRTMKTTL